MFMQYDIVRKTNIPNLYGIVITAWNAKIKIFDIKNDSRFNLTKELSNRDAKFSCVKAIDILDILIINIILQCKI